MSGELIPSPPRGSSPARLFTPTPKAAKRVRDFFTAQLHNDHTRKAYLNATRRFAQWCEAHGIHELAEVEPFHVAAFIKDLQIRSAGNAVVDAHGQATPGRATHAVRLARDRPGD